MEHTDVIREIDALIDSYNWPESPDVPYQISTAQLLKDIIRTHHEETLHLIRERIVGYYDEISEQTLVMTLCLLKILENPRIQHKGWVFRILCRVSLKERSRHTVIRAVYRLFLEAKLTLRRFLNHHRAEYRVWSARILVQCVDDPHSVSQWILARLEREKSPHVISSLLFSLTSFLPLRRSKHISQQTQHTITTQAQRFLSHSVPLVRIAAISLCIEIFKRRTPDDVIEQFLDTWVRILIPKENRYFVFWRVLFGCLQRLHLLGEAKAFEINLRLLSRVNDYGLMVAVQETVGSYRFSYRSFRKHEQCIAFSRHQTLILESLMHRRPFWGSHKKLHSELIYYGLAPTRAALRQQLKHAQIIESPDEFWQTDDVINLISYPAIYR